MHKLIYIALAVFFSNCGANYHLKRAYKHIKAAEQKGAKFGTDTVYKNIEVVRPAIRTDTIVKYLTLVDSIRVNTGRPGKPGVKVVLKIDTVRKTVYVRAECPPDTLRVRVPVATTTTISPGRGWGTNLIGYVICATLGFVLGMSVRKMLT